MVLLKSIKQNLHSTGLFGYGENIVIGVSGGPDSMAMMHILNDLQYEYGFQIHIGHINHHLRRTSNIDERFVQKAAENLNLPISIGHWYPTTKKKGSVEERARLERFRFLTQLAKKVKSKTIVLAHTQDDLAETVLMRILRGTGLQGLRGILPIREMGGIYFVRPFLKTSKAQIMAYLKRKKINFRTDPTNKQTQFFRNKIRIELLPLLEKKYNKNIKEILLNMAETAGTDYAHLEDKAKKIFEKIALLSKKNKNIRIKMETYNKQHESIKRLLLRIGIEKLKGNTNLIALKHWNEIDDLIRNRPKNSIVHLPKGIEVRKETMHLILSRKN